MHALSHEVKYCSLMLILSMCEKVSHPFCLIMFYLLQLNIQFITFLQLLVLFGYPLSHFLGTLFTLKNRHVKMKIEN